jgi:phage tail-like protein
LGKLTIGRNPDNGLVLNVSTVSRAHAELDVRADGVFVTDVGSSGGTFVGDTRLLPQQPRQVAPGEEIRIGPYILIYLADPATQGDQDPDDMGLVTISGEVVPPPVLDDSAPPTVEQPVVLPDALLTDSIIPIVTQTPAEPEPVITRLATRQSQRHFARGQGLDSLYLRYLPGIFQESDFLGRYLKIFETIWEPQEWRIDHVSMYFDPHTCPPELLEWLASWLDLAVNNHWPEARRRRLLAEATDLYRWRGTRYGMTRMIEVCTGLTPDISDSIATPFVFRVQLHIPAESDVDAALIEDLVRFHKPAHAGYVIEIT